MWKRDDSKDSGLIQVNAFLDNKYLVIFIVS